jgi:transcriptional regulator
MNLKSVIPKRGAKCRCIVPTSSVGKPKNLPKTVGRVPSLQLKLIEPGDQESLAIWNFLIMKEHKIGLTRFFGKQLKYLVGSKNGWLGAIGFSSSALQVKGRDLWIGWSPEERKKNQHLVINMSRFLIRPSVKCRNLATRVLGMCYNQVVDDWFNRYNEKPVLMETFVDPAQFVGTSFLAGNWKKICKTAGRGRQDSQNEKDVGVKDMYVFPLTNKFRKILCNGRENKIIPINIRNNINQNWIDEEFSNLTLGDSRLEKRAKMIVAAKWRRPCSTYPQIFENIHQLKGAYKFFSNKNEEMSMDNLIAPHIQQTIRRMASEKVVIAASDTTFFDYDGLTECEGLSYIGKNKNSEYYGIPIHTTIAFTEEGIPLGLIDVQHDFRGGEKKEKEVKKESSIPIEEKESFRWIQAYRKTEEIAQQLSDTKVVFVCDREGDIYELFEEHKKSGNKTHLLVRSSSDRKLEEFEESLSDHLASLPVSMEVEVQVPKKNKQKQRTAKCELKYTKLTLKPPQKNDGKAHHPIDITFVLLKEINAPKGVEPIEWRLITTVEVKSDKMALKAVTWYKKRWGIEEWHRIIKSGCKAEERYLESADALKAALAFDLVIAWRVLMLTKLGRETPDLPCEIFFDKSEWEVLCNVYNDEKIKKAPTLSHMILAIAIIGGYKNRKSDGPPGAQNIWRGLMRLHDITMIYCKMSKKKRPNWHIDLNADPNLDTSRLVI